MAAYTTANRILRDDLLAQLRTAGRPLATVDLRLAAPVVPVAGAIQPFLPLYQQVYAALRALVRQGLVTRESGPGRTVVWSAAPNAADAEIAALEAAYSAEETPRRSSAHRNADTLRGESNSSAASNGV